MNHSAYIEVGAWRKSSRSGSSGASNACVEVGAWRKSSRSGGGANGSNCIEVAACTNASHGIAIRDTKYRQGAVLAAARPEWTAFVTAVKAGSFDA